MSQTSNQLENVLVNNVLGFSYINSQIAYCNLDSVLRVGSGGCCFHVCLQEMVLDYEENKSKRYAGVCAK